jgi:glycine cleavage system aminomethyltransferase T
MTLPSEGSSRPRLTVDSSLIAVTHPVKACVGLLDWSTIGEFEIQGPDALQVAQKLIVNDASKMSVNRVLYTIMLDAEGGSSLTSPSIVLGSSTICS